MLVVTEPSQAALHDMKRLLDLADHFKIPAGLCINKADINPVIAEVISRYATERGFKVLGELPYDPEVTRAQVAMKPFVNCIDNETTRRLQSLWQNVSRELGRLDERPGKFVVES